MSDLSAEVSTKVDLFSLSHSQFSAVDRLTKMDQFRESFFFALSFCSSAAFAVTFFVRLHKYIVNYIVNSVINSVIIQGTNICNHLIILIFNLLIGFPEPEIC